VRDLPAAVTRTEACDLCERLRHEFTAEELASKAKIFYTGPASLSLGRFAILGLNPAEAGDVKSDPPLLGDNLTAFADKTGNDNFHRNSPLGRRFSTLIDYLGEPHETVFTSNVIFRRSASLAALGPDPRKAFQRSWVVLKQLLDVVRPSLILAIGSGPRSAFFYLREQVMEESSPEETALSAGHGRWQVRRTHGSLCGRGVTVVGVPHLSYYEPKPDSDGLLLLRREIDAARSRPAGG